MHQIDVQTERKTELVNITEQVRAAVRSNGAGSAALVYVPHTTAAVTINENIDRELALGTYQGIFFCEFDGPRKRKVYVTTLD